MSYDIPNQRSSIIVQGKPFVECKPQPSDDKVSFKNNSGIQILHTGSNDTRLQNIDYFIMKALWS